MASHDTTQAERKRKTLREKRRTRLANDEKTLEAITGSYITLEANLNSAKKLSDENKVEIADLERDQSRYDAEIKNLEQEKGAMTEQAREDETMELQGRKKIDDVYNDAAAKERLKEVQTLLKTKKDEHSTAEKSVASWRKRFTEKAKGRDSNLEATKLLKQEAEEKLLAITTAITNLKGEEQDLKEQEKRYKAPLDPTLSTPMQQSSTEKEEREKASKCKVLKELKTDTDKKLRAAKKRQVDLSENIETAKRQLTPIKKKKNDLEREMNERKEVEQHKHAKLMMYIKGDLIPEAVDSLKAYLIAAHVMDNYTGSKQKCFTNIWMHLERKKIIEVGNYFHLRFYIDTALSNHVLVEEIAKREDELLEQYGFAHMPSQV